MVLTFIICFITTWVLKKVILRQLKQAKKIDIANPRGVDIEGGLFWHRLLSDDSELAYAIISCINNEGK